MSSLSTRTCCVPAPAGQSGKLAEMVDACGAKSTDLQNPEDVHDLCAKCKAAADSWEVKSRELWEASGGPEKMGG